MSSQSEVTTPAARESAESTNSESSGISVTTTVNVEPTSNPSPVSLRRMSTADASHPSYRSPELSASIGRVRARPVDEHCTHITMTRIFTDEYNCSKCFRASTHGWLWRCTQDRELTLENDEDRGTMDRFDALSDIFGSVEKPLKRSPAARENPLSFFDEVSCEQLRTYSADQIDTVLSQRKAALDVARRANTGEFRRPVPKNVGPTLAMTYFPRSAVKPWLPLLGGECQTKFCHNCWPHGLARSYLSIDGIINGDLPREAVHGVSFLLKHERTVHDANVVANLGFRPVPLPAGHLHKTASLKRSPRLAKLESLVQKSPQGLGITTLPQAGSTTSSTPPGCRKIKARQPLQSRRQSTKYPLKQVQTRLTPLSPTNGSFPPPLPYPPSPTLTRRHSFDVLPDVPLPEQTEEELYLINSTLSYADYLRKSSSSVALTVGIPPTSIASNASSSVEEVDISDFRLLELPPVEKEVASNEATLNGKESGVFGAEPVHVDGGSALPEESNQKLVPDIMTQY